MLHSPTKNERRSLLTLKRIVTIRKIRKQTNKNELNTYIG